MVFNINSSLFLESIFTQLEVNVRHKELYLTYFYVMLKNNFARVLCWETYYSLLLLDIFKMSLMNLILLFKVLENSN